MSTLFKRHKENTNQVVLLTYKGRLTFDLIHSFIENVDETLEGSDIIPKSKRKIFNVLVEVFQNLTHHIENSEDKSIVDDYKIASLKVWLEKDNCFIATGNYILNENVPKLNSWLTHINSLDMAGVKLLFREVLNNNTFSPKGGGGLGFIDITKKSGNKFKFSFEKVNEDFSYFNFETLINIEHT